MIGTITGTGSRLGRLGSRVGVGTRSREPAGVCDAFSGFHGDALHPKTESASPRPIAKYRSRFRMQSLHWLTWLAWAETERKGSCSEKACHGLLETSPCERRVAMWFMQPCARSKRVSRGRGTSDEKTDWMMPGGSP